MQTGFPKRLKVQSGFSLLEMLLATLILLIGLVAVAQLVPVSLLMNSHSRSDSASLVFAERELDQFLDQPLTATSFTDSNNQLCYLGDPTQAGLRVGNPVVLIGGQTMIDFSSSPSPNYSFTYGDPSDPLGIAYDVRWAVITTVTGSTVTGKRIILGVRQLQGSNSFVMPATIDTMVER